MAECNLLLNLVNNIIFLFCDDFGSSNSRLDCYLAGSGVGRCLQKNKKEYLTNVMSERENFNTNVVSNSNELKSWPAKRRSELTFRQKYTQMHKNSSKGAPTNTIEQQKQKKRLTINLRHGGIRMPAKRNSRRASLPKARLTSVTSVTARFKLILISNGLTQQFRILWASKVFLTTLYMQLK